MAMAALSADVLVVAAYGLILPQAVLDLPTLGCLNIHASLLPRWRGAAPIQRAVLAGDSHTGICIMQMDAGLDTGDVLLERTLAIGADETVAQLHDRLAALGATALLEALPGRCRGSLKPRPQPQAGASYAQKLTKAEAQLDFSEPALVLHRQIRAFNPWPVADAQLQEQRVRIWRSRLVDGDSGSELPGTILQATPEALIVVTGKGLIELRELQWPGKPRQSAATFSQGRNLTGERFVVAVGTRFGAA
jgi:methionyl-tRNA formyltransferase